MDLRWKRRHSHARPLQSFVPGDCVQRSCVARDGLYLVEHELDGLSAKPDQRRVLDVELAHVGAVAGALRVGEHPDAAVGLSLCEHLVEHRALAGTRPA